MYGDFCDCFRFLFQSISVTVSSEMSRESVELVEDKDELSSIYMDCFTDSQVKNISETSFYPLSDTVCHVFPK